MQVMQIRPQEQVDLDESRLNTLYAQLGAPGAEDVVCRAMEDLAVRLSHCDRLYRTENWKELRKNSRSLIAIADQVGMRSLSRSATAVTECIDAADRPALAATLSRLMRIGERSLCAIWDLGDPAI